MERGGSSDVRWNTVQKTTFVTLYTPAYLILSTRRDVSFQQTLSLRQLDFLVYMPICTNNKL